MKTIKVIIAICILAVFAGNAISQTTYSFNDGLSAAKKNNKKVLIGIYVDNDSWCEKMSSVYAAENIKNYINSNFIFVKLNAQGSEKCTYNGKQYSAADLVKLFGATGYPTHVFLGSDGSVLKFKYNGEVSGSYSGYVENSEFDKILKYFAGNQYKDTDLSKVL
jgi:thioredoxin-related protein